MQALDKLKADILMQLEPYIERYQALSGRDQMSLNFMAVFLSAVIIYLGVLKPIDERVEIAENKVVKGQELLDWMHANAHRVKSGNSDRGRNQSILSVVNSTARKNGLSLKRIEPEGNSKIRVWLESAPFNKTTEWLYQLESDKGITLSSISLEASDDTGRIDAKLVLIDS